MISYINKKGNIVPVTITHHAKKRFIERYNRLFSNKPISYSEIEETIEKWWSGIARKDLTKNTILRKRSLKHGDDTLYFISTYFVFVVQNATIVTVELGSKDSKHLNKRSGISPIYKNDNNIIDRSENDK